MRGSLPVLVTLCAVTVGCPDPLPLEDDAGSDDGGTTGSTSAGPTTAGPTTATANPTTTVTTTTASPTSITDPSITQDGTDTATTDMPECIGVGEGPLEIGQACALNEECASGVCTIYTDAPLNPDAICDPPPLDCSMRVTGTVLDIVTQQPVAGADFTVATALQAATDPTGADPVASAVSAPDGRIDTETFGPPQTPIGLVALASFPAFHLTATGLASPRDDGTSYGVANDIHDIWLVSDNAVAAWSNMLALDPAIDPASLPLGPAGGVVGLARHASGVPLAGVSIASTDGASTAFVRYLNLDGTFNTSATTNLGLFVILEPALAEVFEASLDGMVFDTGTAGSAPDVVFTLVFTAS